MLEENNNQKTNLSPGDYYKNKKDKILDFCLGFFGFLLLSWLLYYVNTYTQNSIILFLSIAIAMAAVVFVYSIKRRFIALGIAAVFLLPFVFVGGCFVVFFAGGFSM